MNGQRGLPGPFEPHVGIGVPQQGKPSFQPVQRPFSMPAGTAGTGGPNLPFLSFDLSSASSSFTTPPGGVIRNSGLFEDEPPLLEELGINTSEVLKKTRSVLNPIRLNAELHEDADLSGPVLFFLLFGLFQLLAGKVQFGVILGWLAVSSLFLYTVFNLLVGQNGNVDLYRCLSLVGYCLLPMVVFSAFSIFVPRKGPTLFAIASLAIIWSTRACTNLLVSAAPHAEEHRSLVAYATGLIYTAFSLLVLF